MTKSSADGSGTGKMSGLFTERSSVKSKKLVQDWVNSSPAGNMADVANETSLHFSGSIAQSNQAIVQRPPQLNFQTNTSISLHMVKLRPTSTSLSMSRKNQVVEPM